jgi:hypothetical protein
VVRLGEEGKKSSGISLSLGMSSEADVLPGSSTPPLHTLLQQSLLLWTPWAAPMLPG